MHAPSHRPSDLSTFLAAIPTCLQLLSIFSLGGLFGCAHGPNSGGRERTADFTSARYAASTNAFVRQVGPGLFEIGDVRLDQKKGTITFPATVNLREGPIEYLIVTDYGKIHESLLRTAVSPMSVQTALLLLGASPPRSSPTNTSSPQEALGAASRLRIDLMWKPKKRVRTAQLGDFVRNRRKGGVLGQGEWFFAGSRFREDGFAAQADGSIITVIDDEDAIIGSAARHRDDDDNWLAAGRRLPEMDGVVEVRITLVR